MDILFAFFHVATYTGARRGELYSKYTYYHDYYYSENNLDDAEQAAAQDAVTVQR